MQHDDQWTGEVRARDYRSKEPAPAPVKRQEITVDQIIRGTHFRSRYHMISDETICEWTYGIHRYRATFMHVPGKDIELWKSRERVTAYEVLHKKANGVMK